MRRRLIPQIRLIVLAFALLGQSAQATISLNQLSACAQLRQFRSALGPPAICQPPTGRIAQVLKQRIQNWPGINLCFRSTVPTNLLAGFTCTNVDTGGKMNSLLCWREVRSADIQDYKTRYRQVYDPLVKQYLASASRCDAGNGDASTMANSMLPWIVSIIAKHSFGFALPIGNSLVGSSSFIHGFGRLDPEIYASDTHFIEYLYTWVDIK